MGKHHDISWPGEDTRYRAARDELLEMELDLRRRSEAIAAKRRALPRGGRVPEDYTFEEAAPEGVREVRLSQLFADGKDTLILYSFMYASHMRQPCPMCVSFLDSLEGQVDHIAQRANLAVIARSDPARLRQWAADRQWQQLRLLSSRAASFHEDYHTESPEGSQWPLLYVFRREGDAIYHFFSTEMFFAAPEPEQHPRHVDPFWPLWNVLDLTPEGRGANWYPALSYS